MDPILLLLVVTPAIAAIVATIWMTLVTYFVRRARAELNKAKEASRRCDLSTDPEHRMVFLKRSSECLRLSTHYLNWADRVSMIRSRK